MEQLNGGSTRSGRTVAYQRRARVGALMRAGETPSRIAAVLERERIHNPRTGKPYQIATILNDMQVFSEMVGRTSTSFRSLWSRYGASRSIDSTRTDYRFWDEFRRGFAEGFRFGGLFAQPLVQAVASFVLAPGYTVTLEEMQDSDDTRRTYTNDMLMRWMRRSHALLIAVCEDMYALGDQFVVVNHDGSLTVTSPETVDVTFDAFNARQPVQYVITTLLEKAVVTDTYTPTHRVLKVKENGKANSEVYTYENLIGRIPIVHFANDRSANEQFGRPIYEALYHLFERWDVLFEKTIDGVELHGNPIPVFENLKSIEQAIEANKTSQDETTYDPYGGTETRTVINFDRLGAVLLPEGGRVNMLAPNIGFTNDIRTVLREMFLMIANFTRMPEGMWAGATEKGDIEDKILPFIKFIESKRAQFDGEGADDLLNIPARGGLLELADVWLRTRRLVDPKIVIAPTRTQYAHLRIEDEQISLQKVIFSRSSGMLNREDSLAALNLVADPMRAVQRASAEQPAPTELQTVLNQVSYRDTDPQAQVPEPEDGVAPENPAGGEPGARAMKRSAVEEFNGRYGERLNGDRSLDTLARVLADEYRVPVKDTLRALRTVYRRGGKQHGRKRVIEFAVGRGDVDVFAELTRLSRD